MRKHLAAAAIAAAAVTMTPSPASAATPAITGRIVSSAGKAMRGADIAAQAEGDDGGVAWSAKAISLPDGRFTLPLPATAAAKRTAAANGGILNVWIDAPGASRMVEILMPGGTAKPAAIDLTSHLTASQAAPASSAAQPASIPGAGCSTTKVGAWQTASTQTEWEPVASIYADYDQQVSITYSTQSDSDFGVGVKYEYKSYFDISGTSHVGNTNSFGATTPRLGPHVGRIVQAQFTTREQYRWVSPDCYNYAPSRRRDIYRWQGGLRVWDGVDLSSWNGCDGHGLGWCYQPSEHRADYPYPAPEHVWKSAGRSVNFGSWATVMGLGVGGTSDYSTHMQIDWWMGRMPYTHSLFGHNGPPTGSAEQAFSY